MTINCHRIDSRYSHIPMNAPRVRPLSKAMPKTSNCADDGSNHGLSPAIESLISSKANTIALTKIT